MIKLVIFDWNGVLIADTRACLEADNYILKEFGGKPVSLKVYKDTRIIPSINFYTMHGANERKLKRDTKAYGEIFHRYYERRTANIRTRRGAKRLLQWLKDNSIESVILSNHLVSDIESKLKKLELEAYFSSILANPGKATSLVKRNKLEKLRHYLKGKGHKKDEVLIIGDSPEETEIGKSIGIKTASITGGYYATWRLKKAKPDYIVGNLADLVNFLCMP